jgi:hypothetical protein
VVGRIKRGNDVTRPEDKVKGLMAIAGFARCITEFNMLLDIQIHYV